jgi:hypothetical protein
MCTCNDQLFCLDCIDLHVRGKEFTSHRILPIGEVERLQIHQQDSARQYRAEVIESFQAQVPKLNESLLLVGEEIKETLARRREELVSMIDDAVRRREIDLANKLSEATRYFTRLSEDAECWKNTESLNMNLQVCQVIDRLQSSEDLDSVGFIGRISGKATAQLKEEIEDTLSDSIQLFQLGRPRYLYYFKAGTSDIKRFDVDTYELLPCYVKAPVEFKDRMAWCEIPDGTVIITGGWLNRTWSAEAYRLTSARSQIEKITSMLRPRSSHCSVYCCEKVIVLGGVTDSGQTASCEILDLGDMTWRRGADMAKAKSLFTAAAFKDKVYVLGDTEIEVYDPSTNIFSVFRTPFPNPAISLLVPKANNLLAFRDNQLSGINVTNEETYSIAHIVQQDWWSPTQAVVKGPEIYMMLSATNSIVKFSYFTRSVTEVCKLNARRR